MWEAAPKFDDKYKRRARHDNASIQKTIETVSTMYHLSLNSQSQTLQKRFQAKVSKLNMTRALANKKGGKSVKLLLNRWESQHFTLTLTHEELHQPTLLMQNANFRTQCNDQQDLITNLRSDLTQALAQLQRRTLRKHNLTVQARRIAKKLLDKSRGYGRKKCKGKSFQEYGPKQKRRLRGQFIDDAQLIFDFLKEYKLIATEFTIFNEVTKSTETLELSPLAVKPPPLSVEMLQKILAAKERYNVTDAAYKEMSSVIGDTMPRMYQLQKHILDINKNWPIIPTPNNIAGWQLTIKQVLTERATILIKENPSIDHLDVKLSGDGTQIGRTLNLVQMSLTILQEGNICKTCTGNHLLALFRGPEKYHILAQALEDIANEIGHLNQIEIPGKDTPISITWYLGGDYKFILASLGLDGANSTYACAWCTVSKEQRGSTDPDLKWSMSDPDLGARNMEKILQCSASKKKNQKYNCSHPPLFPSIDTVYIVIDLLHMFLRIGNNLLNFLIVECRRADGINMDHRFTVINREKWTHMALLETFITETCKVPFNWQIQRDTTKLEWRELRGPELKRLFKEIKVATLLPQCTKSQRIQTVWDSFYEIYTLLHNDSFTGEEIDLVEAKIDEWFVEFRKLFAAAHVTPYIHILKWHVPEMLRRHGTISMFTQEGLEKLNDKSTVNFFASTNRHGTQALKQLLLKAKRVEYYDDHGFTREKAPRFCSHCNVQGHYKLTCPLL